MNFKNQAYEDLVRDLINDAFYIDSRSNRGKISTIRQYAEVVIRKLLDLPNNKKVTLGDYEIIKKLKIVSSNNKLLMKAVKKLQEIGNKCTHTQNPYPISEENVSDAINELFNLYASIFVIYFQKYKFGSNNEVTSAFSILPPIIRYIVLDNLYKDDKKNLLIIDKLSLVLLKAFDKESALKWVEDRKDELSNTLPYTQEGITEIESSHRKLCADAVVANAPESMYNLCLERLEEVSSIIDKQGLLYNNFEQAKPLYIEKGILSNDSQEHRDFNSIMEFVYLGRKAEENEKLENLHLYNITV
ncbi:hypothetical protein [Candidatus Methylobacter oryzae]|uniref:DUF4145 domain-containing protein n=1 Tax=Candidatus Methylobacter oryzae TaxID=2497749 RepID=A0ABY3C6J9_9GAMM|nr:hypothetical protein [Candidatus Methylobacter oryzae]TRW91224.1 hypothetical protein EKO24_017575 [Candidatus Methylobacter oryzae]